MSPANNYKKFENKIVEKISKFFRLIGHSIISFFKLLVQKGKQRFTVMFIPHSEKKIVNFHISVFSLVFLCFLLIVLLVAFFGYSTYFAGAKEVINEVTLNLKDSQRDVENFEDEIKQMTKSSIALRKQINSLFKIFGKDVTDSLPYTGEGGDIASWNINSESENSSPQLTEVRELRKYMDSVLEPLAKIENFFERQKELLVDIPNAWPVAEGVGRTTAYFGAEEHPFTHSFRLHYGLDIAWTRGTPVISTAEGVVEKINFNPNGLGNNITIRHKYGFVTKYGHLDKILVQRGQRVKRGGIIGLMGSTGLSTGPHVHYEVWIGDQVVDPVNFLDINTEIVNKIK